VGGVRYPGRTRREGGILHRRRFGHPLNSRCVFPRDDPFSKRKESQISQFLTNYIFTFTSIPFCAR
jgi:hypothetical protein